MKYLIVAAALAAGWTFAMSTPVLAAAKNYDCTKAGNANKAACRNAAQAALKSAKPAKSTAAAKPASTKVSATTTSTRHYDCTKAGNASKPECKVSAASKHGAAKTVAAAKAAPAARMAPAPGPTKAASSKASDNNNPAGAIARCKDGTYSHSKSRSGTCSRHGGVAKWS